MRTTVIFSLLFLACSATWAQLTPNQLLANAWDDPAVQLLREQQAYLDGHDFDLPLLRKLELRTETRDWDPKQQEYALRINANSPGMRRTQAKTHATMKSLTEAERQVLVQDALLMRYELLIDAHFAKKNRSLLLLRQQVLQDKKAVFGQQLTLGIEQDLDDYFRAEEDLLDVERSIFENGQSGLTQRFLVGIFTGKEDNLRVDSLASVAALLPMTAAALAVLPPSVKREQVRAELAALEAELEQKEGNNFLSYFQFGYTGNANDLTKDRFKLAAGFTLPWPNNSELQEQERELQALEAKAEAEAERQSTQQAALLKLQEFTRLVHQHTLLKGQAQRFAQQYDPQRLLAAGLQNPETLLRVKESLVRLELETLALEKDIYQAYLELLGETGLLVQVPARNWLSPSMELIAR